MKKFILLLLFLSSPLLADTKKYDYPDPHLNAELDSVYKDLLYLKSVTASISSATITSLQVSTVAFTGRVTVRNGTVSTDAASFGQLSNATQNILDNGGFEIWQRGTSFTSPADGTFTTDRWKVQTDDATHATVTREPTTIDSVGLYSMKVVVASVGASKSWYLQETLENYADYRGKTLTVSVRVNTNVANAVRIRLGDSVSQVYSSYHTGGGGWETLTASYTMGASETTILILLGMIQAADMKNGTYYFDSAMLTVGSEAVTFVPTNPAVDLNRCERFFQIVGNVLAQNLATGMAQSTTLVQAPYRFGVTMRATPTATIAAATNFGVTTAAGATNTLTTFTIDQLGVDGCRFLATGGTANLVAGNASEIFNISASGTIQFSSDL